MNDQLDPSSDLEKLLHQVKMRRYKEGKDSPKKVLMEILDIIERKKHYYGMRNWELLVELMATWLKFNADWPRVTPLREFPDLDTKRHKDLFNHIDKLDLFRHYVVATRAKPWDHLGELYTDLNLVGPGQNMTPRGVVEMMIKMTLGDQEKMIREFWVDEQTREYVVSYYLQFGRRPLHLPKIPLQPKIKTVLDPCVGTGRFLIGASYLLPKAPLILFGIEINLSLYRACLVNMKMFSNHPYTIICADTLRLDHKLSGTTSPLWDLGNRWTPPDVSKYYWKPPPIRADAFSLEAFTKLMKT